MFTSSFNKFIATNKTKLHSIFTSGLTAVASGITGALIVEALDLIPTNKLVNKPKLHNNEFGDILKNKQKNSTDIIMKAFSEYGYSDKVKIYYDYEREVPHFFVIKDTKAFLEKLHFATPNAYYLVPNEGNSETPWLLYYIQKDEKTNLSFIKQTFEVTVGSLKMPAFSKDEWIELIKHKIIQAHYPQGKKTSGMGVAVGLSGASVIMEEKSINLPLDQQYAIAGRLASMAANRNKTKEYFGLGFGTSCIFDLLKNSRFIPGSSSVILVAFVSALLYQITIHPTVHKHFELKADRDSIAKLNTKIPLQNWLNTRLHHLSNVQHKRLQQLQHIESASFDSLEMRNQLGIKKSSLLEPECTLRPL